MHSLATELVCEGRLANPRVAGDQDESAVAAEGRVKSGAKLRQLSFSADKHGHRRLPKAVRRKRYHPKITRDRLRLPIRCVNTRGRET